jgi:hypothetical protein
MLLCRWMEMNEDRSQFETVVLVICSFQVYLPGNSSIFSQVTELLSLLQWIHSEYLLNKNKRTPLRHLAPTLRNSAHNC